MMEQRTIFAMHRLAHAGLAIRRLATTRGSHRQSVANSFHDPSIKPLHVRRSSPLDPCKDAMTRLVEIAPKAAAVGRRPRLEARGFQGGITMGRDYWQRLRAAPPVIRFASAPGGPCQTDGGHFGSLTEGDTARTRDCLAVVECHRRLRYRECPHAQRQATVPRGLLKAFHCFQGPPKERVYAHRLTAVCERPGPGLRGNAPVREVLKPLHLPPIACTVAQPQEQGTVEHGALPSIHHNCWPRSTFRDLDALQAQADQWRAPGTTVRRHHTPGPRPIERVDPHALRPLPECLPDCRDQALAQGHRDVAMPCDGNTYTGPPGLLGTTIPVKADHHQVTGDVQEQGVATHRRPWQRKPRIDRPQPHEAAPKPHRRHGDSQAGAAVGSWGAMAKRSLAPLATTNEPRKPRGKKRRARNDAYGT